MRSPNRVLYLAPTWNASAFPSSAASLLSPPPLQPPDAKLAGNGFFPIGNAPSRRWESVADATFPAPPLPPACPVPAPPAPVHWQGEGRRGGDTPAGGCCLLHRRHHRAAAVGAVPGGYPDRGNLAGVRALSHPVGSHGALSILAVHGAVRKSGRCCAQRFPSPPLATTQCAWCRTSHALSPGTRCPLGRLPLPPRTGRGLGRRPPPAGGCWNVPPASVLPRFARSRACRACATCVCDADARRATRKAALRAARGWARGAGSRGRGGCGVSAE